MESTSIFPGKQFQQGNETSILPDMENTPVFPGNQSQQGNEKIMDTGRFTLGNTILNRYPALSTHTHHGMESSNMEAFPSFNFNADATPQMDTPRKGPRADSTPSGKDTTVISSRVTPMDPMDDIQPPTRKCISPTSVHFQDSLSNKSDQLQKSEVQGNRLTGLSHQFNTDFLCDEKRNDRDLLRSWNDREQVSNTTLNTTSMTTTQQSMSKHYCGSISNRSAQPEESTTPKKYLTRLSGYNSTDQLCDREELPTDLSESWSHKELLPNRPELINQGEQVIPPRPLKAMTHRYRHTEKEAHLLSGPSELQPPDASEAQYRSSNQDKNTADSQKQKKLSFKPHLLIMMIETLSDTILSRNFHLTLSTRQNQILPLSLILYFQKEGRKSQKMFLHLQKMYLYLHLHLHLHLHPTGDSTGMTTLHSRIKKANEKELWEASQRI